MEVCLRHVVVQAAHEKARVPPVCVSVATLLQVVFSIVAGVLTVVVFVLGESRRVGTSGIGDDPLGVFRATCRYPTRTGRPGAWKR